jgi:hypothetical protein
MLPRFLHVQTIGAAALGAASLLVSATASASNDGEIKVSQSLDGTQFYNKFTVRAGATLSVTSLASGTGSGRLEIRANTIIVEAGAAIDATGAGFGGVDVANGNAAAGSNGGGGKGSMFGFPGGGGGFFTAGDNGTSEGTPGTCAALPGSPGGAAFFATLMMPEFGSAGGAANSSSSIASKGGAGGGIIILAAAKVTIDGTVQANGAKAPMAPGGVGPGGGSGGSILITAATLAGAGTISVVGGNGVHGPGSPNPANPINPNNGGGGGSGVVILQLPNAASTGTLTFKIQNGSTGDCPGSPVPGTPVLQPLSTNCVDIDKDGVPSNQCGGMDCDDADDKIKPGAPETCDGHDNNCKDGVDEQVDGEPALCPPGSACMSGTCSAIADAGSDAGPVVDAGAPPDHVEFGGGCALPPGLPAEGGAAAALALGALAFSRARRRGRR